MVFILHLGILINLRKANPFLGMEYILGSYCVLGAQYHHYQNKTNNKSYSYCYPTQLFPWALLLIRSLSQFLLCNDDVVVGFSNIRLNVACWVKINMMRCTYGQEALEYSLILQDLWKYHLPCKEWKTTLQYTYFYHLPLKPLHFFFSHFNFFVLLHVVSLLHKKSLLLFCRHLWETRIEVAPKQ